jgi:hypothetical protein
MVTAMLLFGTVAHPFYQRLNQVVEERGFDEFVEEQCERFYAEVTGRRTSGGLSRKPDQGQAFHHLCR